MGNDDEAAPAVSLRLDQNLMSWAHGRVWWWLSRTDTPVNYSFRFFTVYSKYSFQIRKIIGYIYLFSNKINY